MNSLILLAAIVATSQAQLLNYDNVQTFQAIGSDKNNVFVAVYQRPRTNFDCFDRVPGQYYADLSTKCVVYHICLPIGPGGKLEPHGFACPKGKLFDETTKTCQPAETTVCTSRYRPSVPTPFTVPVSNPLPQTYEAPSPIAAPAPSRLVPTSPVLTRPQVPSQPVVPVSPVALSPAPVLSSVATSDAGGTSNPDSGSYSASIAKSKSYLAYLDQLQEMLNRIKAKRGLSALVGGQTNHQLPIRSYKLNRPSDSVGVGQVPITVSNSIQSEQLNRPLPIVQKYRPPVNVPVWVQQNRPVAEQAPVQPQYQPPPPQVVSVPQIQFVNPVQPPEAPEEPAQPEQYNPQPYKQPAQPEQYNPQPYEQPAPVQFRAPVFESPAIEEAPTAEDTVQPDDTDPGYVELPPTDTESQAPAAHMGYMNSDSVYSASPDQARPTSVLLQNPGQDSAKYFMIKLRKKIIKTTVNDGLPPALDPPGSYEQLRPHVTMPEMAEAMPYAGAQSLYETSGQNATATQPGQDDHVFMLSHYSMLNGQDASAPADPVAASPSAAVIEEQAESPVSNVPTVSGVEYSEPAESPVQPEVTEFDNGWRGTTPGPSEEPAAPAGSEAQGSAPISSLNNVPLGAFQLVEKFSQGFRVAAVFDKEMRPLFTANSGSASAEQNQEQPSTTEAPVTAAVFDDSPTDHSAAGSDLSPIQGSDIATAESEVTQSSESTGSNDKAKKFLLPIPGPEGKPKAYVILSRLA